MSSSFKLLYLGMYWDYGDPARDLSFEETNFHNSLRTWSRASVTHFDYVELWRVHGKEKMNEMLLAEAKKGYDALFCVTYQDQIDEQVLQAISEMGTITIGWGCDDHWRFPDFSSHWVQVFDRWVTTSSAAVGWFRDLGVADKVIKSQWACANNIYHPMYMHRDMDATFVGQPHSNRRDIIQELVGRGVPVSVYGYGWAEGSRLPIGAVVELFNRSKVNLNLSNSSTSTHSQIKGRVFEVTGCRSLLLTDMADDLEQYFEIGKELVVYESLSDLAEKTRFYLANDKARERIAAAAYERVKKEHKWHHRYDAVFTEAGLLGG